jgi:hypothetical protein
MQNVMHHYKKRHTLMTRLFLILYFLVLLSGCVNSTTQGLKIVVSSDTTKSFRISDFWFTPKSSFEFNSVGNAKNDTLDLVTCSDYVYFPFGKIKNKTELKTSILKDFNIVNKTDSLDSGIFELQILKINSSKLILFFDNDPEATISSYIIKGEINDKNVRFVNKVAIGMSKKDFINEFFDLFPNELIDKYNVIILESCVSGLNHVYTFKDKKLTSIRFDCVECSWRLDY